MKISDYGYRIEFRPAIYDRKLPDKLGGIYHNVLLSERGFQEYLNNRLGIGWIMKHGHDTWKIDIHDDQLAVMTLYGRLLKAFPLDNIDLDWFFHYED